MHQLTPQGREAIENLAQRHGFGTDAVLSMLQSVINGNGTMAQFSHPEFGGSGQWMQGGMIMLGDMFNHALKARVDGLCTDLSALLASRPIFVPEEAHRSQVRDSRAGSASLLVPGTHSGNWWPSELGPASSTGSQNEVRYAVFPAERRLAIEIQGHVTVYDTLEHRISGASQQQGGDTTLTFTSQYGLVRLCDLPVVSPAAGADGSIAPAPETRDLKTGAVDSADRDGGVFSMIERLADLHHKGVLSDEEFSAKKAELLKRI